jgi:cyclic beta-1,2-glucan synthetase
LAQVPAQAGWVARGLAALALAQRYRDPAAVSRTFALAFAHARSSLRYLGVTAEEAILYERLASRVLHFVRLSFVAF